MDESELEMELDDGEMEWKWGPAVCVCALCSGGLSLSSKPFALHTVLTSFLHWIRHLTPSMYSIWLATLDQVSWTSHFLFPRLANECMLQSIPKIELSCTKLPYSVVEV